ncbi:MAG TPA: hypothetical protein VK421_02780 [Pyrinomonadaceae bacterium]|nr:hypothetical protein [Pyrinomonadaceae bacterium]
MRGMFVAVSALAVASAAVQTGCVFVGGYSSDEGFYVWPGSFLVTAVLILLLWLFLKRRRG